MNFDRLAPFYDVIEAVTSGGLVQRVRTTWIDRLADCSNVLAVGVGRGRFAAEFVRRFPQKKLTCVDASACMLAGARKRVARANPQAHVTWIHARLPEWAPPHDMFDAVVSCFFLDCFPPAQLALIVAALARGAAGDAVWLVADFTIPPRGLARWRAKLIHEIMYGFFRVVVGLPARRLTPPDALLRAHHFSLTGRRHFDWGLLHSDLWTRSSTKSPSTSHPGLDDALITAPLGVTPIPPSNPIRYN